MKSRRRTVVKMIDASDSARFPLLQLTIRSGGSPSFAAVWSCGSMCV